MHADTDTQRLCFINHLLDSGITFSRKIRIPVKVSPIEKRSFVIDIIKAGNLCFCQSLIKVLLGEIGD